MKNIFVGNLSFQTNEQDVRALFEAHGSVDRVNIVTDRESGQPRGFAFVEMTNDAEAVRAISSVNGRDVDGRTLNVNEAKPKGERVAVMARFRRRGWSWLRRWWKSTFATSSDRYGSDLGDLGRGSY